VSAKKARNTPYYLSNIDNNVVESDIYEYMTENGVYVSHIRIFYGRNGCSAKINIPHEYAETIEDEEFWPNGIQCRSWVAESEYKQQRNRYVDRNSSGRYRSRRYRDSDTSDTSASKWGNADGDWNQDIESWRN